MSYKHSINCAVAFYNYVCFASCLAALVSLYVQVKHMFLLFMCDLIYWYTDFKGPCLNVTVTAFAIHMLFMSVLLPEVCMSFKQYELVCWLFQGMLSVPGLFTIMSKVTELHPQVASWIGLFRAQA